MSASVLIPALACLTSSILATAIWSADRGDGVRRISTLLLGCSAFWAACDLLAASTGDPVAALTLLKLSAFGWAWLGPMALHLMIEVVGEPGDAQRRWLPRLYSVSFGFIVAACATPWIYPSVVETAWGWRAPLGAGHGIFWLFTGLTLGWGLYRGLRGYRRLGSERERAQASWIGAGLALTFAVAALSEAVLPYFGSPLAPSGPRLGPLCFAALGVVLAASTRRHAYTALAPSTWSAEIIDSMAEGLLMLRPDGRIRVANPAAGRLAGRSSRALVGLPLSDIVSTDPSELLDGNTELEAQLRPRDAEAFPVSLSSSTLRDAAGDVTGTLVLVRDQRDVAELREQLLRSGRLGAVGELAASISHEINNPASYVNANLVMLRQHWDGLHELVGALDTDDAPDESRRKILTEFEDIWNEGQELIDESLEGVTRTAAIVRRMQDFARGGETQPGLVDLNGAVESARLLAGPRLKHAANVEVDFGEIPPVPGSTREIQQVALSLLINAAETIGGGGTVRLSTRREGDRVRLSVADDGPGLDASTRDRIFDPACTTRNVGDGSGLGLALAQRIVAEHGGEISVDSRPDRGSTFHVRLPIGPASS
jgi:two-component system NtrC family sensor kinase